MMEQHVNNVSTIGVTGNEGIGGMNTTGVTDTLGWLADVPQYVQGANRIAKEVENALNVSIPDQIAYELSRCF